MRFGSLFRWAHPSRYVRSRVQRRILAWHRNQEYFLKIQAIIRVIESLNDA
jgi:hypothetical protein